MTRRGSEEAQKARNTVDIEGLNEIRNGSDSNGFCVAINTSITISYMFALNDWK